MATPTFCPMVQVVYFTKLKRDTTPLLTYLYHLSYLLDESANFHLLLQGVSLKAVIEEVSICVCPALSRQGPRVPPFSMSTVSLQENILRLYGLVSFSIYDWQIFDESILS
jgi:hypothetical protein